MLLTMMLLTLSGAGQTQATSPPSAAPPPPARVAIDCRDDAHKAFDFWIGDWNVFPSGTEIQVATSRIESVVDGCGVRESYHQTRGRGGAVLDYRGTSYTALNNVDHQWHQFYVDTAGAAASYVGTFQNGALVMVTGTAPNLNQMTFTPLPDGSVRQSGAASTDGGATWTATFDFNYRRAVAPAG